MAESVRYFCIGSKDLVYLKFILEAYEGLAILSTADAANGIVRISTPCSQGDDLDRLLNALHLEISLCETIPPPPLRATDNLPTALESCHA